MPFVPEGDHPLDLRLRNLLLLALLLLGLLAGGLLAALAAGDDLELVDEYRHLASDPDPDAHPAADPQPCWPHLGTGGEVDELSRLEPQRVLDAVRGGDRL